MAASAGNAVGTVGGIMKFYEGKKMQKKGQRLIDNFEWEKLQNPFDSVQVSTLSSDLQREEAGRNTASMVNAVQSGGSRSIIGGIGKVQAQNNLVNRQIGADLDQQQKQIDYARAQDQVNIRNMTENRQANELAGYGQMLNVGMGMKYQGLSDVQASAQAQGETNLSIMESVGGMMGGGGGMSDRRLKKNIELLGTSPKGLNIYSFEYIDSKYGKGVYQGVMSDEIPKEAVSKNNEGFDKVDYSKIDVEFKKIK